MQLTLYTRPGCHLCDEMKAVIRRVRGQVACGLTEVDISPDPALLRRYGHDIPVLLADGAEVARIRTGVAELLEALAARGAESDGAPRAGDGGRAGTTRRKTGVSPPDEA